jgi:hypothetical protein
MAQTFYLLVTNGKNQQLQRDFRQKYVDYNRACAVTVPIPVAAWYKAWVCSRLLAGIARSNLAGA